MVTISTTKGYVRLDKISTIAPLACFHEGQNEKSISLLWSPQIWLFELKINMSSELTEREHDRIIGMAWEDRTPFEAIEFQFNLTEKEVIRLMRRSLKPSSFKLWRKRVNSGVSQKHLKKRNSGIDRFKCDRQRQISNNKISKR